MNIIYKLVESEKREWIKQEKHEKDEETKLSWKLTEEEIINNWLINLWKVFHLISVTYRNSPIDNKQRWSKLKFQKMKELSPGIFDFYSGSAVLRDLVRDKSPTEIQF